MIKKIFATLFFLSLLSNSSVPVLSWAKTKPLKIGVLAVREPELCLKRWTPLGGYLSEHVAGQTFVIELLEYSRIIDSVKNREADFILTNPSTYIELEHSYGANRIVTLKKLCGDHSCTTYAGVIIRKKIGRAHV